MKYILDTNIISELINTNPNKRVLNFLNTLEEQEIYLSAITIGEIYFGIQKLSHGKRQKELLTWVEEQLLPRFHNKIINIDTKIMLQWAVLTNILKIKGSPLPIMDSLIGATCLAKNFTLVTRNEKDFQNIDIKIINPFTL